MQRSSAGALLVTTLLLSIPAAWAHFNYVLLGGTPNVDNYPACPAGAFRRWDFSGNSRYKYLPDTPSVLEEAKKRRGDEIAAQYGLSHACIRYGWTWDGKPTGVSVYRANDGGVGGHCELYVNGDDLRHACLYPKYWLKPPDTRPNLGECPTCPKPQAGNPINTATGNKFQVEVDYRGTGAFPLAIERIYNSQDERPSSFGRGWRILDVGKRMTEDFGLPVVHNPATDSPQYNSAADACQSGWGEIKSKAIGLAAASAVYSNNECKLMEGGAVRAVLPVYDNLGAGGVNASPIAVTADRGDGRSFRFTANGGAFVAGPGIVARLEKTGSGYRLIEGDLAEEYSTTGVLTSVKHRSGVAHTINRDGAGRLATISDSFGRSITFAFDATVNRWASITDPDGRVYRYTYTDGNAGEIETITYPDGSVRRYNYSNTTPRLLTGITDENGERFATWTYDSMGRARSSEHGDGSLDADGADRIDITYNADGTTTIVDAIGKADTTTFATVNGEHKPVAVARTCAGCGTTNVATTYDANGFVASRTDFNGVRTDYQHNARGLEESRTEAAGTPLARTITTQWHATWPLPTQIDEPGRRAVYAYDANGNRLTETVTDTTSSESRTTTWSYGSLGRILTVDGPRTDVSDVTTYTYHACSTPPAGAECGQVHTITNALGQVTRISEYDAHGNPLAIEDPNGVVTTLTYDLRQRLKKRTVAETSTSFDYDGVGQLTKVTLPDGSFLSYTYDEAHRLTGVEDSAGNKIHYTLDLMGNRTQEDVRDPLGSLKRTHSQVFDALSRLKEIRNAAGAVVSEFGYDVQGNRTSQKDYSAPGTGHTTAFAPDALNRIKQVTDAAGGVTQYGYNALDQLVSVTDPKSLTTTYTINALGDVTQQVSPDTGTTSYTNDAAGNRKTQTDARGVTASFSYDALNRLTFVDYPGSAEDVTYFYDGSNYSGSIANGIGRLTGIADESGTTTLIYDARGNVTQEQRVIGGTTYTTSYSFTAADRLARIIYPSGRLVTYVRDEASDPARVTRVTTSVDDGTTTTDVATDIEYLPFGGIRSYTLANGVTVTRNHDQDYRLVEAKDQGSSATIQHLSLSYDLRSNINGLEDLVTPSRDQAFGYDTLSRLTSATGAYGARGYSYDGVGNRLTEAVGSATDTYSYPSGSHRLSSRSSGASYAYDGAGNVTGTGSLSLAYNQANRLASATLGASTVTSVYGASGQRIRKTAGGVTTVFHYDRQGRLLAEDFDSGLLLDREYIWLEDIPLAQASHRTIPDFIVDDGTTGFSTVGLWTTGSASGQYGSSHARRGPAMEVPGQTVVDDTDLGVSHVGVWLAQPYGFGNNTQCEPSPGGKYDDCLDEWFRELNVALEKQGIGSADQGESPTFHRSVAPDPVTGAPPEFTWRIALPGSGRYRVVRPLGQHERLWRRPLYGRAYRWISRAHG